MDSVGWDKITCPECDQAMKLLDVEFGATKKVYNK